MRAPAGVVVITGAAGGMGRACASRLAEADTLLLTDREAGLLEEARESIQARATGAVLTVVADFADPDSIVALAAALQAAGPLGAIVHTAGVSPMMADWREVVDVDLVGTARLMQAVLPLTLPGSAAICVASIAGEMLPVEGALADVLDDPLADDLLEKIVAASGSEPSSGIAYAWAKAGVIRLCERLAEPWGRRGARIVSIQPGLIDTPMGRLENEENPAKELFIGRTPLVRERAPGQSELPGRADDIASLVAFLCSDEASFITGCGIRVDGGLVASLRDA